MYTSGKIRVVVGGQYGSESKGRTVGYLTSEAVSPEPQLVIRTGGPQAGHIVIGNGPDGPKHAWKLRCVPVAAVTRPDAVLAIAAGSEVDIDRMNAEINELDAYGYAVRGRLHVDTAATVLTPEHKEREDALKMNAAIGSTSTGVGAARSDRIMRTAAVYGGGVRVRDLADQFLARPGAGTVTIEASQGCHLDLFRGPYPYCTSTRTTAIDALAMAEVVPWLHSHVEFQVWVVARTYPIRVAGNSGPLKDETSWEAIGREPEITTVTKRVRRVAEWDPNLVAQSVRWCGGAPTVRLSLSHLDYLFPDDVHAQNGAGLSAEAVEWLGAVERQVGAPIGVVGLAPDHTITYRAETL